MVFKKIIGLLMVVAMLCTVLMVTAKHRSDAAEAGSIQLQDWVYDTNANDPTEPENYQAGSTSGCSGESDICGISAPLDQDHFDETGVAIPEIDPELESQILAKEGTRVSLMN